MDSSAFKKFITDLHAVGLKNYLFRCEGGNRICYHNEVNSFVIPEADVVYVVEVTKNPAANGQFNVLSVPYEDIDTIKSVDIGFNETIDLCKKIGIWNTDLEEMFKRIPYRSDIQVGTAGLSVKRDEKGVAVIPDGKSGIVTNGHV